MNLFKATGGKTGSGKNSAKATGRDALQYRSKYINHSLDFLHWVNGLGFERTILGRIMQHLDQRLQVRKLSLLFLFSMSLSFLLFFDFDFSDSVKIGEVASHDIRSPITFQVVDEVATEEKRQIAESAVPAVFDYDRYVFEDIYNRVYNSFRKMRELIRLVNWSDDEFERDLQIKDFFKNKQGFETALGRTFSDPQFEWLVASHFSPHVENLIVESLEHWTQFKIVDGIDKQIQIGSSELSVREISRAGKLGHELLIPISEFHELSHEDDFKLPKLPGISQLPMKGQRTLFEIAHSLLVPNITLNKNETNLRRNRAREDVLPVILSVTRNQTIVSRGAVIRPGQVSLLREIEIQRSNRNRNFISLVAAIMFLVFLIVCFSYLRRFTLNRVRVLGPDIAIMGVVTLLVVMIAKLFMFFTNTVFESRFGSSIPDTAILYAAPVAAGPMLVGLMITSGEVLWIFTTFLAVAVGLMADQKFSFVLVTISASIAAARGVYGCKKRNDVYWAGVRTGLIGALMIALVTTVEHLTDINYKSQLLWTVGAGFVSGLLSALVTMMLIPLLETIFNCTTDVKLLELSNLNHPLLKEMIVKAPGTYHHSLVVGSMVEAAAEEIGANSLLAKVMSYYHDIGKMEHSAYFIENQKAGSNPHDHLSPHMSKTILIAHVKDGVELGLEHKLGKPIIDGIVQHHGTTLISFFYNRAQECQDVDMGLVAENDFRYPGPKPQFREAALIMLADSIEAASRSLDEPTPVRLQNIVKNIIQRKFMEGQLDECNLTLKDLSIIGETFTRVLLGIYHQRIDYPKKAGGGASERPMPPPSTKHIHSKKGPAIA